MFFLDDFNYSTDVFWFAEQQEKLRILHEKFKEEVNQQLLGCKNSVEDFEAYHAELKGVADKQSKLNLIPTLSLWMGLKQLKISYQCTPENPIKIMYTWKKSLRLQSHVNILYTEPDELFPPFHNLGGTK